MAKNRIKSRPAEITSAVIYTRVSTLAQAQDGASLDAQLTRCRQLAEQRGLTVVGEFCDEGISGTTADGRPGLQDLLKSPAATNPNCATIVYNLSRLGRSVADLSELVGRVQVISVTESIDMTTASGRLFVGMLSVLAQFVADSIAEQTASTLRNLQANGKHVGRPPYGWRVSETTGELEPVAEEAEVVQRIHVARAGGASAARIARELGKGWHDTRVRRILQRQEAYNVAAE